MADSQTDQEVVLHALRRADFQQEQGAILRALRRPDFYLGNGGRPSAFQGVAVGAIWLEARMPALALPTSTGGFVEFLIPDLFVG